MAPSYALSRVRHLAIPATRERCRYSPFLKLEIAISHLSVFKWRSVGRIPYVEIGAIGNHNPHHVFIPLLDCLEYWSVGARLYAASTLFFQCLVVIFSTVFKFPPQSMSVLASVKLLSSNQSRNSLRCFLARISSSGAIT